MNAAAQTMEPVKTRRQPEPRNGVDTPALFATIDAVRGQPELGSFEFRATNHWISGTHSRSSIDGYFGAGAEHRRAAAFSADADHTAVLCGDDNGPTPVEYLLHALAACITAGIGNIAAARGVTLHEVKSTVVGNIDLRGILGITDEVRNGYSGIRATFSIRGDAPAEKLAEVVAQAKARSAVFDVLANGVPVSIEVDAA